jgi:hypothetical protein
MPSWHRPLPDDRSFRSTGRRFDCLAALGLGIRAAPPTGIDPRPRYPRYLSFYLYFFFKVPSL